MTRIKIEKTKENKSEGYCAQDDFILLNYKGFLKGKKVEDSRYWFHKPKVFQLGPFGVTKCWDIALQ